MQKLNKKQYVAPTLKERGVVRELTQSSSGDFKKRFRKHRHRKIRFIRFW